jgi:hypothetical protein
MQIPPLTARNVPQMVLAQAVFHRDAFVTQLEHSLSLLETYDPEWFAPAVKLIQDFLHEKQNASWWLQTPDATESAFIEFVLRRWG